MSKTKTALVIACTLVVSLLSACRGDDATQEQSTPSDRNQAVEELLDE